MERMEEEVIDLKDLFEFLLKRFLKIAVATIAGGIAFLLYSMLFISPTYESSTTLLVTNTGTISSTSFMLDCIEIVGSASVATDVIEETGIDYNYKQLLGMLTINNPTNTRTLEITIRANDPEFAQNLASSYAEVAQSRISERLRVGSPEVIEAATVNADAVSPNNTRNAVIGLLAGFVISCGFYVCKYMLDDSVKKSDDVERFFGIKALAAVPYEHTETVQVRTQASGKKVNDKTLSKTTEKGGSKR